MVDVVDRDAALREDRGELAGAPDADELHVEALPVEPRQQIHQTRLDPTDVEVEVDAHDPEPTRDWLHGRHRRPAWGGV